MERSAVTEVTLTVYRIIVCEFYLITKYHNKYLLDRIRITTYL